MSIPKIIAVDGPASSGKSTIAQKLAVDLGYLYFDTGVMYRAVTLAALRKMQSVADQPAVELLAHQIKIDVRPPTCQDGRLYDVLLDGEDITWTIRTPEVDRNVSQVSAYAGVRAVMTEQQRIIGQREHEPYDEILKAMKQRDQMDSTRSIAPLRPAADAIIINTDSMSLYEVLQQVKDLVLN